MTRVMAVEWATRGIRVNAFAPGYFAYRKPEFAAWFDAHRVQLPLAKGDAAFFNPALFHAAGHNRTSAIRRIGNLL